jgi:RND family efflux transporter MFP subunit
LLLAVLLALPGCGTRHSRQTSSAKPERIPRLETVTPQKHATMLLRREYTATIDALEKVDVAAQVRGVVETLAPDMDIGRAVRGPCYQPAGIAAAVGAGAGAGYQPPFAVVADVLRFRTEGETLITLAIPDLLAERENKRALFEQAVNSYVQSFHTRTVAAEEVKEAEVQVQRYQAEVDFRDLQYQRISKLVKQDTVQQQLADEARLQLRAAQAATTAALAQVDTKQARLRATEGEILVAEARVKVARAELDRLETLVGFATIRAPFDGVITKRWVDRGATIKDAGVPLLTVMRLDVVRVILDVQERDVSYFRAAGKGGSPGNPVILRVPALEQAIGKGEFSGSVTLLSGALDPVTRTMRVEIHLPNRAGALKPQMTGTATVVLEERHEVLTVPSNCLVRANNRVYVFQAEPLKQDPQRAVIKKVEVEVALDDGRVAEIRRGLTGKEQILTKGVGVVREGDVVIPVLNK